MSVDEWVTDQVSDIRDFLYALKNFKSKIPIKHSSKFNFLKFSDKIS